MMEPQNLVVRLSNNKPYWPEFSIIVSSCGSEIEVITFVRKLFSDGTWRDQKFIEMLPGLSPVRALSFLLKKVEVDRALWKEPSGELVPDIYPVSPIQCSEEERIRLTYTVKL